MVKIYIGIDENGWVEGWSSTFGEGLIEIEIEENHPFLNESPFNYYYKNGKLIKDNTAPMRDAKKEKKEELSNLCQKDILSGFTVNIDGTDYQFSYDREAQNNLQERWQLFQNNMVEEMNITAHLGEEDARLTVNKESFSIIYMKSVMAKENKIKKLREDLFPLVERAKSQSELDIIKWDMEVIEPKPESMVLKDDKTLDKELDRVESDSAVANNEIINLIMLTNMMGGMG